MDKEKFRKKQMNRTCENNGGDGSDEAINLREFGAVLAGDA